MKYEIPDVYWNAKSYIMANHFGTNLDCHDRLRKRPT